MAHGLDCSLVLTPSTALLSLLFVLAFSLSLLGNTVVIVTILCKTSRTRSITNFYLLNLAIADLLRSVVCIPPTLLSELTHCWLLGPILCKVVAYLQPVGVCASAYTLAVIAIERYYAICRPLESRKWHTKKRALMTISMVWLVSFTANLGSLVIFDLVPYKTQWTCDTTKGPTVDFLYQLYVTFVLLFVPLALMVGLYGHVIYTLNTAINSDCNFIEQVFIEETQLPTRTSLTDWLLNAMSRVPEKKCSNDKSTSLTIPLSLARQGSRRGSSSSTPRGSFDSTPMLRSTNQEKILLAKRKVTRMLITIVIVFAACWVPSYSWWLLVRAADLMGFNLWHSGLNSILTMLTYVSSMANPITYCFMNKSFRSSVFSYCRPSSERKKAAQHMVSRRSASRDGREFPRDLPPANIPLIKIDLADSSIHM